eukprot:3504969-Karenia_brevis.AAC.1
MLELHGASSSQALNLSNRTQGPIRKYLEKINAVKSMRLQLMNPPRYPTLSIFAALPHISCDFEASR